MPGEGAGPAPIKPVTSAYAYFQSEQYAEHKDEFAGLGLGQQGAEIARRWKAMRPQDKVKYEAQHAQDRRRHQAESEARDAEVAAQQAANREARFAEPASEGYMRQRAAPAQKKERKVTREEDMSQERLEAKRQAKEKREQEKAARIARENESDRQKSTIAAAAAAMARKRIKYILRQSDIFATHFGVTLSESDDDAQRNEESSRSHADGAANGVGAAAAGGSASKRRRVGGGADESVDADANGDDKVPTYLMQQPPSITGGTMRPYQLEGLNWMINLQAQGTNGILADEMGLGKTLQSISILAYMRDFPKVHGPHLILLPKSVLGNWQLEFKRFCPCVRVLRLSGSKDERAAIIRDSLRPGIPEEERGWDVLLTTYEVANIEKTALNKIGWRYLIIDEAHRLKNESSLFSMTVRELTTQYRLLLTGTPLQNNLHELWALLNFLLPTVFKDADAFSQVFDLNVDDADKKQNMITQLHKILRPFMLRRLKKEVEKSLPPKEETILFTGMSEVQRKVYKGVLMRDIDTVNGTNAGRTAILNIVMQLRKCCNHPYLFPNTEDRSLDPMGEHLVENCGKMVLLDKLLTRLKAAGHRVLVFSQMTRMMDILEDLMHMRGYEYCRIDGNTPHDVRQDLIENYNAPGSSKFIFLLSTRAGGLGINLQSADTCILYDSDWNPQADLQAQDRCHRIGQTKTVKVYRLVTEDTIEEKVVERAQQKLKLDAMVVQRGMLQGEKKVDKDEMLAAIRFGADAVFRSKNSVLSDQDLDAVLERGAKKTKEMQSKLNVAEKGDMLDFSFNDGAGVQHFEGIDYADRKRRDELRAGFIDIGPRERKPAAVKAYAPPPPRAEPKKTVMKLPKELELPQMKDHQMFDRERIVQLQDKLQDRFKELKDGSKIPADCEDIASLLLPPQEVRERAELISQGFSGWTRNNYYSFLDGLALFGRDRPHLVAPMVGKPVDEVKRYAAAFWRLGPKTLTADTWRRIRTRVEMREKKINETNRCMMVAHDFIEGVENPWNNMEVRVNQRQGGGNAVGMQLQREWTKDEDRYLLCLTHLCGWGNWHKVRACILASPRFMFDYYLRSLSESALGKHCEQLIKTADKYLQDLHDRQRKDARKEMEERSGAMRDEAAGAREDMDYENRLRNMDSVLTCAEEELADAEGKHRNLELIAEGLKNGSVSLDNPNVRTLLEVCAANGIGTTGLVAKGGKKASAVAGDGGRKSPTFTNKKASSPGGAEASRGEGLSVGDDEVVNGKVEATSASAASSPNGAASAEEVEDAQDTESTTSEVSEEGEDPTSQETGAAMGGPRRRTPTKSIGKPGLPVPQVLWPELARMIEAGDLTSKEEMLLAFQRKHRAYTQVSIQRAVSIMGEKPSRGSKWELLEAGKKYVAKPVFEGVLPEEAAVLASAKARRILEEEGGKKRKSSTVGDSAMTPKATSSSGSGAGDKSAGSSKSSKSSGSSKSNSGRSSATGKSSGKGTSESKGSITKFFPSKGSHSAGSGSSTPSKKRKLSHSKEASAPPASPGASAGFMAFCRANKNRVQAELGSTNKADIVDRLVYLWQMLDPTEVERWNSGVLPAVPQRA